MNYLLSLRASVLAETSIAEVVNAKLGWNPHGTSRAPEACMTKEELQERSLAFAATVRRFGQGVMAAPTLRRTGEQLINCSASMAANYRAACRARSRAEFVSKLGTVVEESDEAVYWLEYIARTGMMFNGLGDLLDEAHELRAIFAASYGTARANYKKRQR